MTPRFQGQHAAVLGGARGIGAAVVEQLRMEGAEVHSGDILDGSCDVTDPAAITRFFGELTRLDVLICVAGAVSNRSAIAASEEDWRQCQALNLESVWLAVHAALPLLRNSPAAAVVTIPSYQALRPGKSSALYATAKGGLISLTRALAVELAPAVRVNGVIPGQIESVRTEEYFRQFRDPQAARRRTLQSFPLGRLGKPQDIAKAVAFLASPDAEWITGTCLLVDGGRDAAGLDLSDLR